MSKEYLATFSSEASKVYLEILNFISVDVQSVSKVYLVSFDPCTSKFYFIVFKLDL